MYTVRIKQMKDEKSSYLPQCLMGSCQIDLVATCRSTGTESLQAAMRGSIRYCLFQPTVFSPHVYNSQPWAVLPKNTAVFRWRWWIWIWAIRSVVPRCISYGLHFSICYIILCNSIIHKYPWRYCAVAGKSVIHPSLFTLKSYKISTYLQCI